MEPHEVEKAAFVSLRSVVPDRWVSVYLVYRYGMLFIILSLLGWEVESFLNRPPGALGDPYSTFVCCLSLLLTHLAYFFEWRRCVAVALIVVAAVWILFAIFYIHYLSPLLYPLPGTLQ